MWTYSGDPNISKKDGIRLLVGDTDETKPLLQDEEITFLLASYHYPYGVAANACMNIAAKMGRNARQQIGQLRSYLEEQYEHYRDLARYYFMMESGLIPGDGVGAGQPSVGGGWGTAEPFAGGIDSPSIFKREM